MQLTPFLLFLIVSTILIFTISDAYAIDVTANLLPEGQVGTNNDEIVLDDDTTINLSEASVDVDEFTETIGLVSVDLSQEIQFVATIEDNPIILQNSELTSVLVEIPDQSTMSGPATWDGTLSPPKEVKTSGKIESGFRTPTSSFQIGSPDSVLIFDNAVTITFEGVTGEMAYKLPNTINWVIISECSGSFANPGTPSFPNECSISNGIDTKVVTFHFTEYTELDIVKKSSGGSGRTGVGPTSGGSSRSGTSIINIPLPGASQVFPAWFQYSLVSWWTNDSITDTEFKNAVNYLLNEKIINLVVPEKPETVGILADSTKKLFGMWSEDRFSESSIIQLVHYYRSIGVW